MNWFERLTGFKEAGYKETQSLLEVQGERLVSKVNGKSHGIGSFELVSVADLRERARSGPGLAGRLQFSVVQGDARALHRQPEFAGALFQVASQLRIPTIVTAHTDERDRSPVRASVVFRV